MSPSSSRLKEMDSPQSGHGKVIFRQAFPGAPGLAGRMAARPRVNRGMPSVHTGISNPMVLDWGSRMTPITCAMEAGIPAAKTKAFPLYPFELVIRQIGIRKTRAISITATSPRGPREEELLEISTV